MGLLLWQSLVTHDPVDGRMHEPTLLVHQHTGELGVVAAGAGDVVEDGLSGGPIQALHGPLAVPGAHRVHHVGAIGDDGHRV